MRISECAWFVAVSCVALFPALGAEAAQAADRQVDVIQTSRGPLRITPIFHGSLILEFEGLVIHIDPYSRGDYTGLPQADLIVITHTHADHLDRAMLEELRKPSTTLVGSPALIDTINCGCNEAPRTERSGVRRRPREHARSDGASAQVGRGTVAS